MQRLRMTLHDTVRICGAYKMGIGLQATAKMTLFAWKWNSAFVDFYLAVGVFIVV